MPAPKLHILLADDEVEIATLVSSVLRRSGHTVDITSDGQAAVNMMTEKPGAHDLIITDSNMPNLSGIELIEHLRKTHFPGKIILFSGHITPESKDVYQALNIDRIIQKPFAFAELIGAVKELGEALRTFAGRSGNNREETDFGNQGPVCGGRTDLPPRALFAPGWHVIIQFLDDQIDELKHGLAIRHIIGDQSHAERFEILVLVDGKRQILQGLFGKPEVIHQQILEIKIIRGNPGGGFNDPKDVVCNLLVVFRHGIIFPQWGLKLPGWNVISSPSCGRPIFS